MQKLVIALALTGASAFVAPSTTAASSAVGFGLQDLQELAEEQNPIVGYFEEMYGTLAETTTVVSNRMIWKDGVHAGFTEPLIHMYNKSQKSVGAALENAVLVGDSLGDSTMADGAAAGPDVVLKIGYLNAPSPSADARAKYARAFDVVVRNDDDATMGALRAVCGAIVAPAASSKHAKEAT